MEDGELHPQSVAVVSEVFFSETTKLRGTFYTTEIFFATGPSMAIFSSEALFHH